MPYIFRPSSSLKFCPLFDRRCKETEVQGLTFDSESSGEWIDPATADCVFRCKSGHKAIYDLVGLNGWYGVNQRVRDVIEEFEPGIHQFIPTTVLKKDGTPFNDDNYFILNIRQVVDAIIIEKSDVYKKEGTHFDTGEYFYRLLPDPSLTFFMIQFDNTLISGKHLWRGKNHLPTRTFCSDELLKRFDEEGFKRWDTRFVG